MRHSRPIPRRVRAGAHLALMPIPRSRKSTRRVPWLQRDRAPGRSVKVRAPSRYGRSRCPQKRRWELEHENAELGVCFGLHFGTLRLHFDTLSYTSVKTRISSENSVF